MWTPGRIIMAAFALFIAWTLLRAWRTGRVYSGMWSFDADENPVMYGLMLAGHAFILALFVWTAAGYGPQSFLDLFGPGWLDSFRHVARHA